MRNRDFSSPETSQVEILQALAHSGSVKQVIKSSNKRTISSIFWHELLRVGILQPHNIPGTHSQWPKKRERIRAANWYIQRIFWRYMIIREEIMKPCLPGTSLPPLMLACFYYLLLLLFSGYFLEIVMVYEQYAIVRRFPRMTLAFF